MEGKKNVLIIYLPRKTIYNLQYIIFINVIKYLLYLFFVLLLLLFKQS